MINLTIIYYLLSIVFLSFILIKATDLTVIAIKRISEQTRIGSFALSAIVLAIGTSFPEMSVGVTSALQKANSISLGDIIGSNIANISMVLGIAGLSVGKIYIRGSFMKKEVWIALITGIAPLILISDGSLTRPDGIILLAIYIAYSSSFFRKKYEEIAKDVKIDKDFYRFLRKIKFNIHTSVTRNILRLLLGLGLMLVSAAGIVNFGVNLANIFNLPVFVIGLVIVAIGTSLPELVFSFRTLRDHEPGMFFGNILGSTIANSTLVVGITTLINPIHISGSSKYLVAGIFFVLISVTVWVFARTKRRIDWWESLSLLLLYVIFVLVEIF